MIYHWCPSADWRAASGEYWGGDFERDGFVHCSFRHQVERTASALERGRRDLVLLCIDDMGLPVILEDCHGTGEEYPHVYGPIPLEAVVRVLDFSPQRDGTFRLPSRAFE